VAMKQFILWRGLVVLAFLKDHAKFKKTVSGLGTQTAPACCER
jgi:hypothetical protein